ncbi:MAG TPA: phosphoadenylyl-sulfate reductase [Bacteroidales bacterium]|jgi:phosphoadenosine phosphosulfate reductase|nr:phosphoadenylyl-sulfate reductase [Bacteroidales bacterium]HBZ20832.1 phosphoadenylyl-sulfate reductase [Bacteroidales bacterium]
MGIDEIRKRIENKPVEDQLKALSEIFPEKVVFTSSFGIEDQVISHFIFENNIQIDIATLDTGRLFPQTYKVFSETIKRYGRKINTYFPDYVSVEKMVTEKGPFSFYHSRENRLECCRVRKLEPLNRVLKNKECWISGIRADQSDNRRQMDWIEYDEEKFLFKFYPLFTWTLEDVERFIKQNNIPYNVLHDKGFVSIGCEPCTRAVEKGADFRSGRWWWEEGGQKECGLHIK